MSPPYDLAWWGWVIGALGAFMLGVSKTGIVGLGILAVALFTFIFPARASTGIVLPLLIVGDIMAVLYYRRSAVWAQLLRLIPWTVVGVAAGYFALGKLDAAQVGRLIGAILLGITGLQFWRMRSARGIEAASERISRNLFLVAAVGIAAGFFTMLANASGPIIIIYLLAMGLPKIEFMGTGAWFYFLLNLIKVPFSWNLGLLTPETFAFDALLAPFVILGGLAGYQIFKRLNQKLFEELALGLTALAALRLLFG